MISAIPGSFPNPSWHHNICWNSSRGWENPQTSDDGGWSLGAPGKGSGWNSSSKMDGGMNSWQAAVEGNTTPLNSTGLSLNGEDKSKEWPLLGSSSNVKSSSSATGTAWMDHSSNNMNNVTSDSNWSLPQDLESSGKHLDTEMTFELDPVDKDDAFFPDMNWNSEEVDPKHMSMASLASPRFSRSPKIPQVADIISTVDSKGVAETGYIPFGNPLKQVHSSDRRWTSTSKDSVSSTGSSGSSSLQSPQRSNMNSNRMYQGKLGNPHSKLSTSNRGDKMGGYNRTSNKPKNISIYTQDSVGMDKEPTGWGDLPSPNADPVDNGTSDWARPYGREKQRMLIKNQLDGINGWDTGVTAGVPHHWSDSTKTTAWADIIQQNGEDSEGWCTVNGKPTKTEIFNRHVQTLVEMGFKKEDCERVLKVNNHNLEHALGDLLALKCTEEMNLSTTAELTTLQSVTTTTAATTAQLANMLAKTSMTPSTAVSTTTQMSVSSAATTTAGTVNTSSISSLASQLNAAVPLSSGSLSQAVTSSVQSLPSVQGQFNPQMLQPPVLPAKLLTEYSSGAAGQPKQQQLLSHLKLVNYHLQFLTKMQQTLFQKLSILNDTSAMISGLPPPLVQQQKQEVLLQLQQVNTMIVIYSQQSVLLKQLSTNNANGSGNGTKSSAKVGKATTGAAVNSDADKEVVLDSLDQKSDQEIEGKDKVAEMLTSENETSSNPMKEAVSLTENFTEQSKPFDDSKTDEVNEIVEEKVIEITPSVNEDTGKEENIQVSEVSASLTTTSTSSSSSIAPTVVTASTLPSVASYDDDNFPPEFQPGKPWVPRSQATEPSQLYASSKSNTVQPFSSSIKSVSATNANIPKQSQTQVKANKFPGPFTMPPNTTVKVALPSGMAPMSQAAVRPPGIPPPPIGNKFTPPSTRQIQSTINNLMFAQLGNNAAAAAAARKGNFPPANIPGAYRPSKKGLPMAQFPPPPFNGFGSFPNLPQQPMPPPRPMAATGFPMKTQSYSPHNMKKSSSFSGKVPPGVVPIMQPQQKVPQQPIFNYQGGMNKPNRPTLGGTYHSTGALQSTVRHQQTGGWDGGKFGSFDSLRPPVQQQKPPSIAGLSGAVDQQLTAPLGFGESLWSDNPHSPVSVTSPDPTFAEWQAGKKAHIFKLPSNSPSCWLVLRNLPPQLDQSTLRDLCSENGLVQTFFMNETMQSGLVRYSSSSEAMEAKIKLERVGVHGINLVVDFASDSDIGEFIDSMSPRQGSPPPLSFTAPATNDECWEDSHKPSASDSKWFSATAPLDIAPNQDVPSAAAWKGGDLFAPWSQSNDPLNNSDGTSNLATSPSMATFLPNGLL
ncbi:trinucleotide repeat-containing gene 6C protein-like isoform X3 [Dysidea avara]|uniref:trinucleotide repeat-containing gene 6C protein-like isoform X3 n=1 Tax=Dysidea avara TaxID=196820 RepID=UPI00332C3DD0